MKGQTENIIATMHHSPCAIAPPAWSLAELTQLLFVGQLHIGHSPTPELRRI